MTRSRRPRRTAPEPDAVVAPESQAAQRPVVASAGRPGAGAALGVAVGAQVQPAPAKLAESQRRRRETVDVRVNPFGGAVGPNAVGRRLAEHAARQEARRAASTDGR